MQTEEPRDYICPSEWIEFERELRRRHLSSDDFELSVREPMIAVGSCERPRDLVTVRHRPRSAMREYDYMSWKTDLIREVNAGAF